MSKRIAEKTRRGKTISYDDFLAILKGRGVTPAELKTENDERCQFFRDTTNRLVGWISYQVLKNGQRDNFFAMIYAKNSEEPNVLESAWLGKGLDPYLIEAEVYRDEASMLESV